MELESGTLKVHTTETHPDYASHRADRQKNNLPRDDRIANVRRSLPSVLRSTRR